MPNSFLPVEPEHARVLILGTMPSVRSLEKAQYYGHPRNQFWPLIFALWGLPSPEQYDERISFIKEKHIALWDVLESCQRQGSMDANIKAPKPNDIPALLKRQPEIRTLCFNSQNAEKLFHRLLKEKIEGNYRYITLPSSSPARAMRFEQKLAQWRAVRLALEEEESP